MNCLDNNVEFLVSHWLRLARQRSLDHCKHGILYKQDVDCNTGSYGIENCRGKGNNNSGSICEHYKESLNPMTKGWRESLRKWEGDGYATGNQSKKVVHWSKKIKQYKKPV